MSKVYTLKEIEAYKASAQSARQSNASVKQSYQASKVKPAKSWLNWVLDFLTN